jgi:hypothetical protein
MLAVALFGLTFSGREVAIVAVVIVLIVAGAWALMRRR